MCCSLLNGGFVSLVTKWRLHILLYPSAKGTHLDRNIPFSVDLDFANVQLTQLSGLSGMDEVPVVGRWPLLKKDVFPCVLLTPRLF